MWRMLCSLWQYRHFIIGSIRNELLARFSRSKLGGLWMIINPLSQVAIYALVLSNVLAAKMPQTTSQYDYTIHLMAGLLAWSLFSEIITRCLTLFIARGNLMKKMCFPRIALPSIVIGSSLLNNTLLFIAMLGVFFLLGHSFNLTIIWIIPLIFTLVALAVGIGLILGVLNVFVRDVGQLVPVLLQLGFWMTPIVYPKNIIPEQYQYLLSLNPLYGIVNAYQQILLYGQVPNISTLYYTFVTAMVLLLLSLFIFRRASGEMVDVL